MKLYIDNKEVELDRDAGISVSLSVASISRPEYGRTGYSKTIRVPMTPANRAVLGDVSEVYAARRFNREEHSARIEAEGCVVIEGEPMLVRYESEGNGACNYCLNIIGAGKAWVQKASEGMFRELGLQFETEINESTVYQSWTWDKPVRFFPVQRDRFVLPSDTIESGVRMLTFQDYHPFINVRAVMEAIAAQAGYTISSQFMDGAFFRSLYMSGKYPEKDAGVLKQRNGFLSGRLTEKEGEADRFGRVYADPLTLFSSVGNIVESADPGRTETGGWYAANDSLRMDGQRIAYYPAEAVTVGFEYRLRYRTQYVIGDRTRLRCFDRVCLDDGIERKFRVVNGYADRRADFRDEWGYRLIVFGHEEGNSYRFTCSAEGETVELKEFGSRSVSLEVRTGKNVTDPLLWVKTAEGTYVPYEEDWALYDGYVEETGEKEIELTVRSAASRVLPSEPKYFDRVYFGGADPGMKLVLRDEVTLKPVFIPYPSEGTKVGFEDVAAHEIRQIDFVHAIRQMFHLFFYTDDQTRTIYAEPRDSFYREVPVVDWSGKMDYSRQIRIEEPGADIPAWFTLRYQPGDGATARWDEANKKILGRWSTPVGNRFAESGEKVYSNPVFTPSIDRSGSYPDAVSASLVQVGDRDRSGAAPEDENLNFPPKIVRYVGMEQLPENQRWGWPVYGTSYPRIGFHDAAGGWTLGFEDRDGVSGLHTHYDRMAELYRSGRRITAYLHLSPGDVEAFAKPNGLMKDFRALFRLKIEGESVLCRLEEICDYNPAGSGSTRCVFFKEG